MKIVLTGGGSGGHITPILAVADELKRRVPSARIIYIGQTKGKLGDIPASHPNIDELYSVRAGKFRRYHGQWWRNILDIPLILKNMRDGLWVLIGIWQSYRLLKKLKPAVVFIKGGFVGVPVGLAAGRLKIPYVTHDSDAIPGLANRLIAGNARAHGVAGDKKLYPYSLDKTYEVGVPLSDQYKKVNYQLQNEYRRGLGIASDVRVICITGGGLGAQRLNEAMQAIVPVLLEHYPSLVVLHIAGRAHEHQTKDYYGQQLATKYQDQVIVKGFVNDLYRYTAAADLVVSRAGATQLAELAVQAKATVIIPNPLLTGGHQLKNAEQLVKAGAVALVPEAELKNQDVLLNTIRDLLDHQAKRQALGEKLGALSKPDATKKLVDIILEATKQKKTG